MTSDALLLGRATYEMLAPFWSALPNNEMGIAERLNSVPKYVVSTTLTTGAWENSVIINNNVLEAVSRLKQQPGENILMERRPRPIADESWTCGRVTAVGTTRYHGAGKAPIYGWDEYNPTGACPDQIPGIRRRADGL